ncbi:PoNe immunity protein domain-containing protein [Variovorax boronicumulans]
MADFYSNRRERFLNEEPYLLLVNATRENVAELEGYLNNDLASADENAWSRWHSFMAGAKFSLLIGQYSAGRPVTEVATAYPPMLRTIEAQCLPNPTYQTEPLYLEELDGYHYAMTLLSLAKLLRHDDLVPRVAALFDVARSENRGKDALYETLLGKLGLSTVPAKGMLRFLKAHPLLLKAIEAPPQKRPLFIAEFLRKWYSAMKGTYWHGLHDKVPQSFFGYWAFEAGLVTYLWDIDDSSYRDLPFYPKDLVDYARTHGAVASPDTSASLSAQDGPPVSTRGGEPCPLAGWWFTPAKAGSRRYFKADEVMPVIEGSSYGATFWQWSTDQTAPKL